MNRVNTIGLGTNIKPWLGKDREDISEMDYIIENQSISSFFFFLSLSF